MYSLSFYVDLNYKRKGKIPPKFPNTMTTYVYETIPADKKAKPTLYEIQQSMRDEPLTRHPETGEPIRRVILGGYGTLTKKESSSGDSCGAGCGCH